MRHLKIFEEWDYGYEEIAFDEWMKLRFRDISDRTIKRLNDLGANIVKTKSASLATSDEI